MATRRAFSEESSREILLSLPVKSLLRFKCVCKNWGSLINNPSFTIDHLNLSKKKKPPQHLIYDYGAANDAPTVTLVSDKGIDEQNFQRFGDNITNLLGSIDGVFFIERQIDNAILCTLWNPANREVRHLPATTISFEYFKCDRHLVFGLDPMTKDYKVVYYTHREEYAAIYSYSRDSWKIFKHNLNVHQNPKMEGPPRAHEDYNWSANLMFLGDSVGILNFVDGTNKTRLFEYRHPGLKSNPERGGCGVYYYKESLVTIKRQDS
ncbi:hypothetical protein KY289_023070 [Solanum tuberosum]|nr:hypothetical protein KY289_023070 [Solanum tuberosum]